MARRVMPQRTNGSNGAHMKQGFAIILPACCARPANGHAAAPPSSVKDIATLGGHTRSVDRPKLE